MAVCSCIALVSVWYHFRCN